MRDAANGADRWLMRRILVVPAAIVVVTLLFHFGVAG